VHPERGDESPTSLGVFRAIRTRNFLSMDRHDQEFFAVAELSTDADVLSVQFGDGVWMVVEPADLWWFAG
jgi:hypothetical protein